MQRLDGLAAFLDSFTELLVGFGVLDTPVAQECDEILGAARAIRHGNDSSNRFAGLDQQRRFAARVDSVHQFREATGGVLNR